MPSRGMEKTRLRASSTVEKLEQETIHWKSAHASFYNNMKLSLLVAFWVTAFSIFSFSAKLKHDTFGDDDCAKWEVGWVPRNQTSPLNGTSSVGSELMWCGVLPVSYHANWANVVQMILFTVYLNTGMTIQLAWQGIVGTWIAALNHWVMELIFPQGGSNVWIWIDTFGFFFVMLLSGSAENTMKFSMNWHCWFMMKFMTQGPGKGTMPVTILGHALPGAEWDSWTATSLLTSAMGALLAIIATVFPPPALTNYSKVSDTGDKVSKALRMIWTRSIDYFCGEQPGGEKYVIMQAVENLNIMLNQAIGDLKASWWESFDLCGQRKRRRLYMAFSTATKKMDAVMVAVKDSVEHEDFGGSHNKFCGAMKPRMAALCREACVLLEQCHQACKDGDIDEEEKIEMEESKIRVDEEQRLFMEAFTKVSQQDRLGSGASVSVDLQNENTFAFALSVFAGRVADLAAAIMEVDDDEDAGVPWIQAFLSALYAGFRGTFSKPTRDRWIFAARNWLTICSCYAIGYEMSCSKCVFRDRDANMAAMMALLINHYSGSAFLNNLKRLLGVVIGKVLPVLILGFVDPANKQGIFKYLDCSGTRGNATMAAIVFVYIWFFMYMYYTSPNWGGIGCLAAGFGAAGLISPCGAIVDYGDYYKEVAQDVFAIFFCLSIDMVFDLAVGKQPRDAAVKNIESIKNGFETAFTHFFESKFDVMEKDLNEVLKSITRAQEFAYEADPSLQMMGGMRTPFKIELYKDALAIFHLLHSDFGMLLLASKEWSADKLPKDGNDDSQWAGTAAAPKRKLGKDGKEYTEYLAVKSAQDFDLASYLGSLQSINMIRDEFFNIMDVVVSSLRNMLVHKTEDNKFQDRRRTKMILQLRVEGGYTCSDDLYTEIQQNSFAGHGHQMHVTQDARARLTVIVKSLENARSHLMHIERLLSRYIVLPSGDDGDSDSWTGSDSESEE